MTKFLSVLNSAVILLCGTSLLKELSRPHTARFASVTKGKRTVAFTLIFQSRMVLNLFSEFSELAVLRTPAGR